MAEVPDKLLRELDMNNCVEGATGDDTPSIGPLTQRLLAGLVEEKALLPQDNTENKGNHTIYKEVACNI